MLFFQTLAALEQHCNAGTLFKVKKKKLNPILNFGGENEFGKY